MLMHFQGAPGHRALPAGDIQYSAIKCLGALMAERAMSSED